MPSKGERAQFLLPNDVLEHILGYGNSTVWNAMAHTCTTYRRVATTDRLWVLSYQRLVENVLGMPKVESGYRRVCMETNFLKGRGRVERALAGVSGWLKRENKDPEYPRVGVQVLGPLLGESENPPVGNRHGHHPGGPDVVALSKAMIGYPYPVAEITLEDSYGSYMAYGSHHEVVQEKASGGLVGKIDTADTADQLFGDVRGVRSVRDEILDFDSMVLSRCRMPEMLPRTSLVEAKVFLVDGTHPARAALAALEEGLEKEHRVRRQEYPILILHLLPPPAPKRKKPVACFARPGKGRAEYPEETGASWPKPASRIELVDLASRTLQGAPFKIQSVRKGEGDMEVIRAAMDWVVESVRNSEVPRLIIPA